MTTSRDAESLAAMLGERAHIVSYPNGPAYPCFCSVGGDHGPLDVAFATTRREIDATRAELAAARQALFECYVAAGGDTDGDDAEAMARSWSPYPQTIVDEVRGNFQDEEAENARLESELAAARQELQESALMVEQQRVELGRLIDENRGLNETVDAYGHEIDVLNATRDKWESAYAAVERQREKDAQIAVEPRFVRDEAGETDYIAGYNDTTHLPRSPRLSGISRKKAND